MAFLEVEHLKYRYPHTKKLALDDISFTAERFSADWFLSFIKVLTEVK